MAYLRKVNRHVYLRTATGKLRPGTITAVGAGTLVDLRVGHHSETYADVPAWDRTDPTTPGWRRW